MKVTQILGSVEDYPDREKDFLDLTSDDLARRVFRARTSMGRQISVSLPRGTYLKAGDVLSTEGESIIAVRVLPEWVLVIRPTTFTQMIDTGHQLGNRHIPIQIHGDEVWIQYHPLLEKTFQNLDIPCECAKRQVQNPFINIFAPHNH